jgi:hypothetical protein
MMFDPGLNLRNREQKVWPINPGNAILSSIFGIPVEIALQLQFDIREVRRAHQKTNSRALGGRRIADSERPYMGAPLVCDV